MVNCENYNNGICLYVPPKDGVVKQGIFEKCYLAKPLEVLPEEEGKKRLDNCSLKKAITALREREHKTSVETTVETIERETVLA